jgi:A/G-specific adenine glycosylase
MPLVFKKEKTDLTSLLKLYSLEKKRDFPWRHDQTPYRVLVSEVMLQQTQVSRVIEKYTLFLERFPTLEVLGKASFDEVLTLWKGLGYMRRIKNLYTLAQQVSTLPREREALHALPGVGEYTSGAVAAFAYNDFYPIIETNIRTVLCVHYCEKIEGKCASASYRELLPELFEETRLSARSFYEAMMDYGTVLKKEKDLVCSSQKKQKAFKGSLREERARLLYLITEKKNIVSRDERTEKALKALINEGFIQRTPTGYEIAL